MKTPNILPLLAACLLASCHADDEALPQSPELSQPAAVVMNASLTPFDDEPQTRAGGSGWADGDRVFLRLSSGGTAYSYGYLTYSASTDSWTPRLQASLPATTQPLLCQAYYFGAAGNQSTTTVQLTATDAVYSDLNGSYTYTGGALNITATLTPRTAKLRLRGNVAEEYYVYGLSHYTSFDLTAGTLQVSDEGISGATGNDGYSPALYVRLSNDDRKLRFDDHTQNTTYVRTLGTGVMTDGHSGYIYIPTRDRSNGWSEELGLEDFTVGGITFRMVKVMSGSFQMGYVSSNYKVSGYHQVTLTRHYWMGEAEVTQELWKAVMGSGNNPSFQQGNSHPVENVSWNTVQTFITNLNAKLPGHNFRLPTEAEWEFAARGGCFSQGYIYSGSNNIDDVCWYSSNSGDQTHHEVKTLFPNELGLYDMSGNVMEWCQDWYGGYSGSAQTDPTGPSSGSDRVYRGGCFRHSESYCRVTYRDGYSPSSTSGNLGFRLASQ